MAERDYSSDEDTDIRDYLNELLGPGSVSRLSFVLL